MKENQEDRRFPIMGGPSLPWAMIEPHERQALVNHAQSLATLASRGGLDCCEAMAVLEDRRFPNFLTMAEASERRASERDRLVAALGEYERIRQSAEKDGRIAALEEMLRELQIAVGESLRCADVLIPALEAGGGGTAAERVEQVTRPLRSSRVSAVLAEKL